MLEKIKKWLLELAPVKLLILFSKRLVIPGFEGMPLYNVASFFIKGVSSSGLTTRASSLAFKFFLAIFPGIIFLITLIPYIPIDNFQDQLLILLKVNLPADA